MAYFPKNRVTPNLYTNGHEYALKTTGKEYIGYYYKLYTGYAFTGKNPQVKPSIELIPYESGKKNQADTYGNFTSKMAADYTFIKKDTKTTGIVSNSSLPTPKYPMLANSDYELGEFERYFLVKRNEPLYVEVLQSDYKDILKNRQSFKYSLYRPFKLSWKITGDPQQVYDTNYNIVLLTEKSKNLPFLSSYISNYTEFYGLYTFGNEYVFEDGTPYKGLYHKMPDGILMTGITHSKYDNDKILYSINSTPLSSQVGNY